MLLTRLLRMSLPALLAGAIALPPAHADVYTWVDQSGSINVSNLAPPDGARVTTVTHASAEATTARDAAARETARQAEAQALAERVRQLEDEVQRASREQQAQVAYRLAPMPPVITYMVEPVPPAMQYSAYAAAPQSYVCDPSSIDCGLWRIPGIYPTTIILLRAPHSWRPRPFPDGRHFAVHRSPVHPPMRAPGDSRRG